MDYSDCRRTVYGTRTYIKAEDKLDKILAFEMLIFAQGMTISMKLK